MIGTLRGDRSVNVTTSRNLPFTCRVWRPAQSKKYNPSDRVAVPDWQGDE
jgi:hypothetical protein